MSSFLLLNLFGTIVVFKEGQEENAKSPIVMTIRNDDESQRTIVKCLFSNRCDSFTYHSIFDLFPYSPMCGWHFIIPINFIIVHFPVFSNEQCFRFLIKNPFTVISTEIIHSFVAFLLCFLEMFKCFFGIVKWFDEFWCTIERTVKYLKKVIRFMNILEFFQILICSFFIIPEFIKKFFAFVVSFWNLDKHHEALISLALNKDKYFAVSFPSFLNTESIPSAAL